MFMLFQGRKRQNQLNIAQLLRLLFLWDIFMTEEKPKFAA